VFVCLERLLLVVCCELGRNNDQRRERKCVVRECEGSIALECCGACGDGDIKKKDVLNDGSEEEVDEVEENGMNPLPQNLPPIVLLRAMSNAIRMVCPCGQSAKKLTN